MEWYGILFLFSLVFFIIKMSITFVFGDFDIDFDCDGDVDFDVSSLFSFKGVLHFILGFSTYLTSIAQIKNVTEFSTFHYILAVLVGAVFMVMLWYIYNVMLKFNHSSNEIEDFTNRPCTVLVNLGFNDKNKYCYKVLVKTYSGTQECVVTSDTPDINIGTEKTIMKNNDGYFI